ncbi:MAG: bifunctional UDP-N-acetylglucosamine diphosphorylase/glucosamine-1-phosphate N-acetyltransferase GlmU [Bifidobacteriaceae bacterium]|jgi:bifunctional UDP-N-acetylglucosamine pyrophosphorylase/glucosamine-1-phosphate N-acetyltransferase|nr:bifunctional UDP-N-acetylglucosamine diphosphorylase/glucosamine-1-phosphate N-acetyltransferase GlmU [Bifidobacteriaceae bacterium]
MAQPAVIILAAGEGTRMKSALPKVLHRIAGRTLLHHAIAAAQALDPARIVVVVRHGRDQVAAEALRLAPAALVVDQDEIPGTGRAVQCALAAMDQAGVQAGGGIVVMPGDTPLLDGQVLVALAERHQASGAAVTVLTASLAEPFGYGRIVREPGNQDLVAGIVEERDATAEQRAITEVNSSVYVFEPDVLRRGLSRVGRDNAQGEVYLTDVVGLARGEGAAAVALAWPDPLVILGVNSRVQLAQAAAAYNRHLTTQAMVGGVTILDPATTWLDADVVLQPDVTLLPGCHLAGHTTVAGGAVVGPFTTLTDCEVGAGAKVDRVVALQAVIGQDANVGPFTYLRPGTVLGRGAKAGSYTELKAATIGDGAKVPHLSYVGDAVVGEGANIGAGTIFANYDGVNKARSEVGPAARVGSNSVVVAPVYIGAGAYTGAGTVVRGDVPPGSLAVTAGSLRVIEGWTGRKRPGTDSAEQATRAERAQAAVRELAEQTAQHRAASAVTGDPVEDPGQAALDQGGPGGHTGTGD